MTFSDLFFLKYKLWIRITFKVNFCNKRRLFAQFGLMRPMSGSDPHTIENHVPK